IQRDAAAGAADGPRAHRIAAGRRLPELAAVLASERFEVTAEALERAYTHVLFDLGAAPAIANAALARLAPVTVLVAAPDMIAGAEAAQQSLLEDGCRTVVILASGAAGADARQAVAA